MEPASAVIGIVSFGFTVFEKVSQIHKSIKGAPQQVQALQDTCNTVEMLLRKLRLLETQIVPHSEDDLTTLKRLCERSQRCLEEVEKVVDKVTAKNPGRSSGSEMKIRLRKWVLNKHDLEDTSKKLKEVREALRVMMDFVQFHYVEYVARAVHARSERKVDSACPAQHLASTSTCVLSNPYRRTGTLQCSHDCTCRCHAHALSSLIPEQLAPYVGQLFISKQLLYPAFTPWNYCNIATCRGTFLNPAKVSWMLPWVVQVFYGSFQASSNTRIHFSINAPRTVSRSSPIMIAIYSADIWGVSELFRKQQSSIWDVDVSGGSILSHACTQWQVYPSETRLGIVRFLVEAGADAALYVETEWSYSAHDLLALGLFQYLLDDPETGCSLTTSIRTNPTAINIFRPIFNMDAMDVLEDLLTRSYKHSNEDVSYLLTSIETTEYIVARSSIFSAIRFTPLEYAIEFSPASVEYLIAEGADVAAEPTLAYAAWYGRNDLIEILIDKGADVNMKHGLGRTALHWACYRCYFKTFFELVRCAEGEIDWDARTPEGRNALDLFELGVSEGHALSQCLTSEQIDEFRAAIISHMDPIQIPVFENETLYMPGAFPLDPEFSS